MKAEALLINALIDGRKLDTRQLELADRLLRIKEFKGFVLDWKKTRLARTDDKADSTEASVLWMRGTLPEELYDSRTNLMLYLNKRDRRLGEAFSEGHEDYCVDVEDPDTNRIHYLNAGKDFYENSRRTDKGVHLRYFVALEVGRE